MCGFNTFPGRNDFFYFRESFSFEKLENGYFDKIWKIRCGFNTFPGRNNFFYFSQSFSFEKLENGYFEKNMDLFRHLPSILKILIFTI